MFEGHEFIKLDSSGLWVLDYTEYNIYNVELNRSSVPISKELVATIDINGTTIDKMGDIPVRIIRKALNYISRRREELKGMEGV